MIRLRPERRPINFEWVSGERAAFWRPGVVEGHFQADRIGPFPQSPKLPADGGSDPRGCCGIAGRWAVHDPAVHRGFIRWSSICFAGGFTVRFRKTRKTSDA